MLNEFFIIKNQNLQILGEKKIHPTLVYSLNLIYEKANLHED
jgi:hypothetical protein